MFFDILGILWLKVENFYSGFCLVVIGVVKDIVMEYDEVVFYIVEYLVKYYLERLKECY